ncbi:hypothetical protein EYF80_047509 [Liparis tanakae]|uniref:Uncharacterized protein n=1 Tax=Liparis tanakae TaxID=230148 RepID=A0A4Z2FM57_9TELE|nr:hypothetical protein EYF80_047509 [Liparis tanakae]
MSDSDCRKKILKEISAPYSAKFTTLFLTRRDHGSKHIWKGQEEEKRGGEERRSETLLTQIQSAETVKCKLACSNLPLIHLCMKN